jgi:NADH:ubiquinone oxidoreductase subunit 5 (subunit L)/multisubunit Na+/H+ antiporter MnhA subunit
MNIVNWLEPVIWNPTTKAFHVNEPLSHAEEARITETPHTSELGALPRYPAENGFNLAHAVEEKVHSETLTEWVFIVISLVVAGIGILLGYLFYIKSPNLADVWAARLKPLYLASYNKYWIDEFFGLTVTPQERWTWPAGCLPSIPK